MTEAFSDDPVIIEVGASQGPEGVPGPTGPTGPAGAAAVSGDIVLNSQTLTGSPRPIVVSGDTPPITITLPVADFDDPGTWIIHNGFSDQRITVVGCVQGNQVVFPLSGLVVSLTDAEEVPTWTCIGHLVPNGSPLKYSTEGLEFNESLNGIGFGRYPEHGGPVLSVQGKDPFNSPIYDQDSDGDGGFWTLNTWTADSGNYLKSPGNTDPLVFEWDDYEEYPIQYHVVVEGQGSAGTLQFLQDGSPCSLWSAASVSDLSSSDTLEPNGSFLVWFAVSTYDVGDQPIIAITPSSDFSGHVSNLKVSYPRRSALAVYNASGTSGFELDYSGKLVSDVSVSSSFNFYSSGQYLTLDAQGLYINYNRGTMGKVIVSQGSDAQMKWGGPADMAFSPTTGGNWTTSPDSLQEALDELGGRSIVQLGETSTTAYRGDRGKTAYDHSQVVTGNPHGTAIGDISGLQTAIDAKAPLASPTFTGTPAAPTAAQGTNTTQVATTAMVQSEAALLAPKTRTVGTGLSTSGTVNLDMAAVHGTIQTITLSGNPTFTTSNRAAGREVTLVIAAGGSGRTLAWPSWIAVGAALPTSLASGKTLVVTVTFMDTTDAAAIAAAAAQP